MSTAQVQTTTFLEYIRFNLVLTEFPDIVHPRVYNFQFILAFATEVYDETTKKGSGTFVTNWSISSFHIESIIQLKAKNPNVKVIISIGGHGSEFPFDPTDVTFKWINEAKKSLKGILNQFKDTEGKYIIDGIDVNYDTINNHQNFGECLGTVIKSLKDEGIITVASISPSINVRPDYKKLYQMYEDYIEWVNYQFYYEKVEDEKSFEDIYTNLALDYPFEKLLAGFSTDPNDEENFCRESVGNNPLHLKSVNHISLICASVHESVNFYEDVLGFIRIRRPESLKFDGAWLFGYGIGIHLLKAEKTENPPRKTEINPKDSHISFQCESMGVVEEKLKEKGINYKRAMIKEGEIVVDQLFFHDPDGNMIEICNCDSLPRSPLKEE